MTISVEENVNRCCAKFGTKLSAESMARRRRVTSGSVFTRARLRAHLPAAPDGPAEPVPDGDVAVVGT